MENLIPMGEREYLVKNYPIQDYTIPKVKTRIESQLTVTSRRIVYTQKETQKDGSSVYQKRDFDINTVDTVDTDFAFKKVYNVALIVFAAIIALVGIIVLIAAKTIYGLIPVFIGGLIITLAILFAKKCYSFNLAIHAFGDSETTHISFGSSSLKPEKEKKKKKKKKKNRFVLLKKLLKPKVKDIGLIPDSIEAMVAEIGSYVVEFKKN